MPIAYALWLLWAKPASAVYGSRTMTAAGPAQYTVPVSTEPDEWVRRLGNRHGAGHASGYAVPGASGDCGDGALDWALRTRTGECAGIPEP